jgi:hypothetical protein
MEQKEEPQQIITAGHYKKRSSLGNEKPEIIRILGPGVRRNSWKSMEGREYSESELMFDWELMDTAITPAHKARKDRLLEGLLPFAEAEAAANGLTPKDEQEPEIDWDQPDQPKIVMGAPPDPAKEFELFKKIVAEPPAPTQEQQPQQPKVPFIEELFAKLSKASDGSEEIEVSLKFGLGFDVNRLRESIALLDLDAVEVTKHIVNSVLSAQKLRNAVSVAIMRELTEQPKPKASDNLRALVNGTIEHIVHEPVAIEPAEPALVKVEEAAAEPGLDDRITELEERAKLILNKYIG